MSETPVPRMKLIQVTEMMSKCSKCYLRETKFVKFPGGGGGGAYLQIPLEARAYNLYFPSKGVGISACTRTIMILNRYLGEK